jgi:hypothetical protein
MSGKAVLMLILLLLSISAEAQTTKGSKREEPIAATVCEILEDPSAFNNKLVEVRGDVTVSIECSLVYSETCCGEVWFALAGGSGAPGLAVTVPGRGTPGGKTSSGPFPSRL